VTSYLTAHWPTSCDTKIKKEGEMGEQILNGTSAQFRLFSASNGRWAKKLKPKGFTS